MQAQVVNGIVSIAVVIALGVGTGCGGGGGGGNDNGGVAGTTPTPARTFVPATQTIVGATPTAHTSTVPTPTPVGDGVTPPNPTPIATPSGTQGSATVVFHVSATATVLGFQFSVPPTAKGRFSGSAALVQCTTPSRELFTKNGKDDGTLILSLAFPTALALPATISCTFDVAAGQQLLATDVTISDTEVTVLSNDQKGVVGDPSMLVVDISVS